MSSLLNRIHFSKAYLTDPKLLNCSVLYYALLLFLPFLIHRFTDQYKIKYIKSINISCLHLCYLRRRLTRFWDSNIIANKQKLTSLQAAIWLINSPSVNMMFCPSACRPEKDRAKFKEKI